MPSTAIRQPVARAPLRPAPAGSVRAMAVVWVAWVVLMAGVNLPTPLYAVYSQLETSNLALLGVITAVMLAPSCAAQVVADRGMASRRAQQGGLVLLAIGLAGLVVASPLGSLALLLAAAVLTGAGHGIGFLYAQDDLNRIAPGDRRGEVTAAFITCIYVAVAGSVIAVGLLDTRISLTVAVGFVAAVLAVTALAAGAWHRYGDA